MANKRFPEGFLWGGATAANEHITKVEKDYQYKM